MKKQVVAGAILFVSLMIVGDAALAQAAKFASGGNQMKSDLISILTPIFGIGIIGAGIAAWFGKISWYWFVGLIVGAILVFGNDSIVQMIRGWFSV